MPGAPAALLDDPRAPAPALQAQAAILARPATTERRMADAIRALAIDATEAAGSGHPGMPMGMADAAAALWSRVLRYDAADPRWPDRDRFVLSAGHGSLLLYALLHLTGHAGMELGHLQRFRQLDSPAAGHPEHGEHPAIEATTGPLGQGLATAVGMALGERMMAARFGRSLVDHRTWVVASDGDLQEGVSHEAACLAGHLRLEKLTVLWDDNSVSIDGDAGLASSADPLKHYAALGWATKRVDGHDPAAVAAALSLAVRSKKPTLIACRTIIGVRGADQGRDRGGARAAVGGDGGGGGEAGAGVGAPAVLGAGGLAGSVAGRRVAGDSGAAGLVEAGDAASAAGGVRAGGSRAAAGHLARGDGGVAGGVGGDQAGNGDAGG